MRRAWLALLALAGCGGDGGEAGTAVTANQIERLSTPREEKADPLASVRLEPLARDDLEREGLGGAGCAFIADGERLLAVAGSDAIVRIGGEVRHLIHSAPAGPTGGFFEDRRLSVSVGRARPDGAAAAEDRRAPARLAVTNRRTGAEIERRGVWTCGG